MKILKKILIVLLCILALPFIIAIFVPNTYTVSVSETINAPRQVVYDYVRMLSNQKDYSVWVMADPNLNPEIVGTDGTVGATQKWNSKIEDVGEGEQEITALTPDKMEVDLRFIRPFKGHARAANLFKELGPDKTEITTEFYSEANYPFNLPSYIFGKSMIEKNEVQILKNIKKILEKG